MARFVRRAVHQRERPLRKAVQIPYGRWALALTPEASAEIVAAAKRRSGPHNGRRRTVETLLWQHLSEQVTAQAESLASLARPATREEGGGAAGTSAGRVGTSQLGAAHSAMPCAGVLRSSRLGSRPGPA